MRRRRMVVVGLLALPALTSCSVPTDGVAGVAVDARGAVFAVVSTCTETLDGASLSASGHLGEDTTSSATVGSAVDEDADESDEVASDDTLGDWDIVGDTSRSVVTLPITGGAGTGLAPVATYRDLPATELSVDGWTRDNSFAAEPVSFVRGDLADLAPGQVLIGPWTDEDGVERHRIIPIQDLHDIACEFAGP